MTVSTLAGEVRGGRARARPLSLNPFAGPVRGPDGATEVEGSRPQTLLLAHVVQEEGRGGGA